MLCPLCQSANSAQASRCRACGAPLRARAENATTPDALPAGATLIGNYAVESVLGQGGFGITYRCHDQMLDRRVAVKEFFPSGCRRQDTQVQASRGMSADNFREARAQFLAEARLLARCHHPGIVGVHAAFEAHQTAYMVMELLHGKTLAQLLSARGGRLEEVEAVGIIERAGAALGFVHELDLLHRDIKPDNIMVCDDGRVMLIDFGTAREFVKGSAQGHTVVVTPGYAPLEQYAKQARRGPFTDIYGLAATLYHLLCGQMPPAASDRAMGVTVRPVREVNPRISASVARAVESGLQMEIAKRPQSVGEFLDLIKAPVENVQREAPQLSRPDLVPTELYDDALRARQQMLEGLLPGEELLPVGMQPVKLAPPRPLSAPTTSTPPLNAPPASLSGASGNVGVKNASASNGSPAYALWALAGIIGFFWLVGVMSSSGRNTPSTPASWSPSYQSPVYQVSPPSYVPPPRVPLKTEKKREAAFAAWNALPVMPPASVVNLPSTDSQNSGASDTNSLGVGLGIEFSPDGKRLAYIDKALVLRVLSLPSRQVVRSIPFGRDYPPTDILFSPDNQTIAVSQLGNRVSAWNLQTGQILGTFKAEQNETVWPQAVLNNGQLLIRTIKPSDAGIRSAALIQWNPKTGKRGKAPFANVPNWGYGALSPDGREFAVGDDKGQLQWLNLRTGKQKAQSTTNLTQGDFQKLYGMSYTGAVNARLGVRGIDYSLDGDFLASRNDAEISVFNSRARKIKSLTIDAHPSMFFSIAPGGKWLAARGALPYAPEGDLLWNVKNGRKIRLQTTSDALLDFGFSQNGEQLYGVFADDEKFKFVTWPTDAPPTPAFTLASQTPFQFKPSARVPLIYGSTVALSNTGRLLAMAAPASPGIEIRQQNGTLMKRLNAGGVKTNLMEFSPDENLLALVPRHGDSWVEVWDLRDKSHLVASFAHVEAITALAFAPDGKGLVCGGVNGLVRWYDLTTRQPEAKVTTGQPVSALAVTQHQLIVLDNLATRTYALPLSARNQPRKMDQTGIPTLPGGNKSLLSQWAISPDGKLLATTHGGQPIQIWDLTMGSQLQSLQQSQNSKGFNGVKQVYGLAFSKDGARLSALEAEPGVGKMSVTSWSREMAK